MANRHWTIRIILLVVLCSMSLGLFLFFSESHSDYKIRRLIESAYNAQRPGGGRLFGAPYSLQPAASSDQQDLSRAQVLLLHRPESEAHGALQGMLDLASGNWRAFIERNGNPIPETRRNPETLNNLGASFLALSDTDPTYLLKALDHFELAVKLDPGALEPRFNLVITYRKLRLARLAEQMLHQYEDLDPDSMWHRELADSGESDDSVLDELRRAAESNNLPEAERLFDKNPELCRLRAMQYGLSTVNESPALVRFIATQVERRYGDKTISAMLAPLFTDRRDAAIAVRALVTQGARLYVQGDLARSLEAYGKADKLVNQTDSLFDRLWIDLNRVDTQIRVGEFDPAREFR